MVWFLGQTQLLFCITAPPVQDWVTGGLCPQLLWQPLGGGLPQLLWQPLGGGLPQ